MSATHKESKKESIQFLLKGIEILDVSLNHPHEPNIDLIVFNFDIKLEHKLNNELKLIIVIIHVDIFNKDKSFKFGSISASCIFEIHEFESFVNIAKAEINFPEEVLTAINSIAISTTRGIMFSQYRGTFLHNAFLPIIDPKSFISQK